MSISLIIIIILAGALGLIITRDYSLKGARVSKSAVDAGVTSSGELYDRAKALLVQIHAGLTMIVSFPFAAKIPFVNNLLESMGIIIEQSGGLQDNVSGIGAVLIMIITVWRNNKSEAVSNIVRQIRNNTSGTQSVAKNDLIPYVKKVA